MNKQVKVVLLDNADLAYKELNILVGKQQKAGKENTSEMQLLRSIQQKITFLKANPFYGDSIEKKKLQKTSYAVQNLWRVGLSGYWRMLYTIKGDEIQVICFILDFLTHEAYNKQFGYKKK